MALLLLAVGFVLFVLGLGYLYKPQWILRFNAMARETFFKDSVVLLQNRRIGIQLLLLSFIILALLLRIQK